MRCLIGGFNPSLKYHHSENLNGPFSFYLHLPSHDASNYDHVAMAMCQIRDINLRCQSEMPIWDVWSEMSIWDVNLKCQSEISDLRCQSEISPSRSNRELSDLRCQIVSIWDVNQRCQSEMSDLRCQSEMSIWDVSSEMSIWDFWSEMSIWDSPPRSNRELSDLRCQIVNARFTWSEIIIFNHNRKGRVCRFQWISSLFEDLNVLDIWYTHRGTTESGHFCCDFLSDIYHVCEKKMVSA